MRLPITIATLERRAMLRAITAASGTALSSALLRDMLPLNPPAEPQRPIRVTSRWRISRPATTPFS
jgi:hypothetical protein